MLHSLIAISLVLAFAHARGADDRLSKVIAAVRASELGPGTKSLADELLALSKVSEPALKYLSAVERVHAGETERLLLNPMEKSFPRWELGYYALEASHWSLIRCQQDFPALVAACELVACLRAVDGHRYAIYRWDTVLSVGSYLAESGEFSASLSEIDLSAPAQQQRFTIQEDVRGDLLIATHDPRVTAYDTKWLRINDHLYIRDRVLCRVKRVTEEYPIEKTK